MTLYFDDIIHPVDGAVLFSEEDATEIIDFVLAHREVESLVVHCYGGESRSRAVVAFILKMCGGDNSRYFQTGRPNQYVYDTLCTVLERRKRNGTGK